MNTHPLHVSARQHSLRTTGATALTPVLLAQLLGIVAFIALAAHLLYWACPYLLDPVPLLQDLALLKPGLSKEVNPKPEERFVFLSLCVLVPLFAWVLARLPLARLRWFSRSADSANLAGRLPRDLFLLGLAWALVFPFLHAGFIAWVLGRDEIAWFPEAETVRITWLAGCVGLALTGILLKRTAARGAPSHWLSAAKARRLCWWVFLPVLVLTVLAWRVFGMDGVGLGQAWYVSLDAAVYALSQVVRGKTLLVDLPSQYGLFPEFLAPVFRLIGLSVFKVSLVFAVLQVLSLVALFAVMARFIKNPLLLLVGGLALVTLTYGNCVHFGGADDVYFQYGPVRFIWPALSVWVFVRFAALRTVAASAWCSLVAALGLLWNLESGLAISIALCGVWFFRALGAMAMPRASRVQGSGWGPAHYALALGVHLAILVLVGLAVFTWMGMKADGPMDLQGMVRYQGIFYRLGFMMLPLPLYPHPWMSVQVVYLLGLLYAFSKWSRGRAGTRADVMGYLSLLGMALFVYYEGRSHLLVLLAVCWPAVIILSLMADEKIRVLRRGLLPVVYMVLPAAGLALLLLAAGSLVYHLPLLAREAYARYAQAGMHANPVVQDEISFIKAHSRPGDACLILSRRQAIYYTEAGLVSPVLGPGLMETLTRADDARLAAAIDQGALPCLFVGVGTESQLGPERTAEQWRSRYRIAHTAAGGTLLHLLPLRPTTP